MRIDEKPVMWLWVDEATGICFPETMSHTEAMALRDTERILGKRRMSGVGRVRAVRVTIDPLGEEETAALRSEFAAWREKHGITAAPAGSEGE
jgi:type IV pilus biogenesis protein CpaD/CtpE